MQALAVRHERRDVHVAAEVLEEIPHGEHQLGLVEARERVLHDHHARPVARRRGCGARRKQCEGARVQQLGQRSPREERRVDEPGKAPEPALEQLGTEEEVE